MSIVEYLANLKKQGIDFELIKGQLKVIGDKSKLSKELLVELKEKKDEIITVLKKYKKGKTFTNISCTEKKDYYPVSSAQKRLYLIQQMDLNSLAYNITIEIKLEKGVDKKHIKSIFEKLINRHESFRTSFHLNGEKPVQKIHEKVEFKLEQYTIEKGNANIIRDQFVRVFDLSNAPLIRVAILEIKGEGCFLLVDKHHIISDGVSQNILEKEFQTLYIGGTLSPLHLQYKDFSEWQNIREQKQKIKEQELFWINKFKDNIPLLNLPLDYVRPAIKSHEGASINFFLNQKEIENIKSFAKDNGLTLNMTLLSAFKIFISKLSNQEDIVIGTPIAGRNHNDLENIVGMFVNTLAIRSIVDKNDSLKVFVSKLKQNTLEAFDNQSYQFDSLVDKISINRSTSHNPVFDVAFSFFDQAEIRTNNLNDFKENEHIICKSKFDLVLTVFNYNGKLLLNFEYCTNLFKPDTIDRFIKYLKRVIWQLPGTDKTISEIKLSGNEEKELILNAFNNNKLEYPKNRSICQLFEEQVENNPDAIAIVYNDTQFTYSVLNEKSGLLASKMEHLVSGSIVGVLQESVPEMVISIMAILKSGGVYLPIDPATPKNRIKYIVKDSNMVILLANSQFKEDFGGMCEVYEIDKLDKLDGKIKTYDYVSSNDPMYIIYTSGSTGTPKGVMVNHKSVINLCYWHKNQFKICNKDNITKYAGLGFDASVWEIFPGLIFGASMHIIAPGLKLDMEKLNNYYESRDITVSFLPTQLCERFMEYDNKSLKVLLTGGDKLNTYIKRDYRLYNNYGPTENTVVTTSFLVQEDTDNIPIGSPISNNSIFILKPGSSDIQLTIGIAGELAIGGESLSVGYLNNQELTEDKFVSHPLEPGKVLYKTGDLACWTPDGNIKFLGRIDNQVKIRGYRIEIGEIENYLLKFTKIKEAVVIDRKDKNGEKYLCAYFTSENQIELLEIKEFLLENLPAYMAPSYFIRLDQLPLNPSGKIDRKILPEPEIDNEKGAGLPLNRMEEVLCTVWSEVIGIEKVRTNQNFFEIGGDSIKAIQIAARLQKYDLKLTIADLFKYQNISALSKFVKYSKHKAFQGEVTGEISLNPIQSWYFDKNFTDPHHFNHSVMLFKEQGFDIPVLEKVLQKLVCHHDALRIIFKEIEGTIIQENQSIKRKKININVFNLEGIKDVESAIEEKATELHKSIILKEDLIKVALFKTNNGTHMLWVIHHLIIDGVSWRILLEDFTTAYKQSLQGDKIQLPSKTDSFKYWIEKQNEYSQNKKFLKEIQYWKLFESKKLDIIPKDNEVPAEEKIGRNLISCPVTLNKELTNELLKKSNRAYNTEINDLLLSALCMALYEWRGLKNIMINLEGHGREDIYSDIDISRTVGWFTSQFPVYFNIGKNLEISGFIKQVKEVLRRLPNKGIGYGMLKYMAREKNTDGLVFNQRPEISFNYLGEFTNDFVKNEVFTISDMPQGKAISENRETLYSLDINGMVSDGELKLDFAFNKFEHESESIQDLCLLYKKNLVEIIEHCISIKKPVRTPSDFGVNNLSLAGFDRIISHIKKEVNEEVEIISLYPLSHMQAGMLFHSVMSPESSMYFQQTSMNIVGDVNIDILEKAFNEVLQAYSILRTVFVDTELEEPYQVVLSKRYLKIAFKDIANLNKEEQIQFIKDFSEKDRQNTFDLSKDILFRLNLIKLSNKEYYLIWDFHHILLDGWDISIIYKDVLNAYKNLQKNGEITIKELHPYKNYIQWLQRQDKKEGLSFWSKYLEGYRGTSFLSSLPAKKIKENIYKSTRCTYSFNEKTTQYLTKIASKHNVTVNTVFQALWGILLQKYTNSQDIVFGAVVSGRPAEVEGIEEMIGLFINTVPIRFKTSSNDRFSDVLKRLQQSLLSIKQYEYLSLAEIQLLTEEKNNLVDHLLIFENYPINKEFKKYSNEQDVGFEVKELDMYEQTNFDLSVTIIPEETILLRLDFNGDLYDKKTIQKILDNFKMILNSIVIDSEKRISDIEIITEEEKEQVLHKFNNSDAFYPKDKAVHELFEFQVDKYPDNVIVVQNGQHITYNELNRKSNQLAHYLVSEGVRNGDLIAICEDRSVNMIIGMLGILKSGGAYIPLDPGYPSERLKYILKDSSTKRIITNSSLHSIFSEIDIKIYCLDKQKDILFKQPDTNLEIKAPFESTMYIIYTSGSTGIPKGVVGSNKGMLNRLFWMWDTYPFKDGERNCQKTSISFVDHIAEIFVPLLKNVPLYIFSNGEVKDTEKLIFLLDKYKISRLVLVPSLLKAILTFQKDRNIVLRSLRYVFSSGEALPFKLAKQFYNETSDIQLINIYGSSEVSADVSYYEIKKFQVEELLKYFRSSKEFSGKYFKKSSDRSLQDEIFTTPDIDLDTIANKFKNSRILEFPITLKEYNDILQRDVLPYVINTASSRYIGHMTSVLPDFVHDFSKMISQLNQNMVKIETSKSLTFTEREAIGILHRSFYSFDDDFYNKYIQQVNTNLGIITTGGTTSNISALLVARNNKLLALGKDQEIVNESIYKVLRKKGYEDIVIIGSRLMHYSIKKSASVLGLGTGNILFTDFDSSGKLNLVKLREIIEECKKNNWFVLALIGVAGTTETGEIDPLDEMGDIAKEYGIHFHVDAAWGGTTIFSNKYRSRLNGIHKADSITLCGHKQMYLPQGISICLFKDPNNLKYASTTASYQATVGSFDFGRYTVEGSKPAISMCLHASLHIIGKKGYEVLVNNGIETSSFFGKLISSLDFFELIMEPQLNIINYRYIPAKYRNKTLSPEDNREINEMNIALQEKQFYRGKTFVSKTTLTHTKYGIDVPIIVFRVVLSNPLTTYNDLFMVLEDQLYVANSLFEENNNTNLEAYKPRDFEIGASLYKNKAEIVGEMQIPIGKPLNNIKLYILDIFGKPVPVGVCGELYVQGEGLAKGYINRPELTAENFVPSPFNKGELLYKTGDLARWLPDGNIDFMGRVDDQVKIRGHRIELGEIETELLKIEFVKEAVVLALENQAKEKFLCAYIVFDTNKLFGEHFLEEYNTKKGIIDIKKFKFQETLSQRLPGYMIPSHYIQLEKIPLTPNGKTDKKALVKNDIQSVFDYVPPVNEIEEKLVMIWSEILGLDKKKVSVEASFFELGGHSLKTTSLISRINKEFDVKIPIKLLFEGITIKEISSDIFHSVDIESVGQEIEI